MPPRIPNAAKFAFLLLFHATFSGAFLVAYLTGDEDTYGMHVFSGYAVLVALALRLAAGVAAGGSGPLRLSKPTVRPTLDWLVRLLTGDPKARSQRSPLLAWAAAALLAGIGLAAVSGAAADFVVKLEDLHEALGEFALYLVLAHVGLVFWLHWLKRAPALSQRVTP